MFPAKESVFASVFFGLILIAPSVSAAEPGCEAGALPVVASSQQAPAQARKANRLGEPQAASYVLFVHDASFQAGRQAHAARHERNLRALSHKIIVGTDDTQLAQADRRGRRDDGSSSSVTC